MDRFKLGFLFQLMSMISIILGLIFNIYFVDLSLMFIFISLMILGIVFGKCYTEISLIFGVLSFGMFMIDTVK